MKLSQWLNRKNKTKEKTLVSYVRSSDLFDERWYLSQYQDVFKKRKDAAYHYYRMGWKENRNPSENFNTSAYLKQYPECGICPIIFERNRNGFVDLSVCSVVKNEAPYIKEWLDYHILVGVKRFYIYGNASTDSLKDVLKPYIKQGVVVYKHYSKEIEQVQAYNECIENYKDKTEWLAVIDTDEFIIPMKNATIPEFLNEYKKYPGIGINCINYDSDGHKSKPQGGVLENYTRVHYDDQCFDNHRIKCIVNPRKVSAYTDLCYAQYLDDKNAVDENFKEIKGWTYKDTKDKAFSDTVSVNKIRINHYFCKSEEEYRAKLKRDKLVANDGREGEFSIKSYIFNDAKYDYTAYKFVIQLNPKIWKKEEIHYAWLRVKNAFAKIKHLFCRSTLSDYIDQNWYFARYPEVKKSGKSAMQHYLNTGWKEGKNPSEYFDTEFYLSRYPDVAKAKINPLLHYVIFGKEAGRLAQPVKEKPILRDENISNVNFENKDYQTLIASELFDKEWYMDNYLKGQDIDPVWHYIQIGWKEGCNPSKDFDTKFYLKQYPDVAKSGKNPFLHYISCGWLEKRSAKPVSSFKLLWQSISAAKKQLKDGVTVIVPTYNRMAYLEKALNILKSQSLSNISFIIVDDGSTDGSADYIKNAVKNDNRFVFIKNSKNQGPSVARNKALDLVETEYVGFFDIDDEIPSDYFENLYLKAVKDSADIVFTKYNDCQHRVEKINSKADKYKALRNGAVWDKLYSTLMLKKNEIKFAEHLYTADNLFNIEAFYAAGKIVLVDKPCYLYELHGDSIGKDEKFVIKRKQDIISICNKAVDFAIKNKFDMALRAELCDFLRRTYDCCAEDSEFHGKLISVLKRTGINTDISADFGKYGKQEYDLVRKSGYFSSFYYLCHNPQLWFSSVNLIEHYLTIGWLEGKNPSSKFDGNKYLKLNGDVAASGINPLLHYIKHGIEEARPYETAKSIGEKVTHALTYPIRVKEEYDRLVAEIKALENMK